MSARSGIWWRVLAVGLVVTAVGFLASTVVSNWKELERFEWRVNPGVLALSVVAHVAVLAWGVYVWSRVLRCFAVPPVAYTRLLNIWALANATRYIPGAVWQFVAAAQLARGSSLPGPVALTSMLVNVTLSLMAAVVVGALTLPLQPLLGLSAGGCLLVQASVLCGSLLLVHPWVVNRVLRAVPRFLHRELLVWRAGWLEGIGLLALCGASWLAYGVAYYAFVASLAPLPPTAVVPLAGVNALAFVAGYVMIFAPGGLGVRESAMTLLLAPILPAGVAAIVAVAARLWSVVAEVGLALAGMIAVRGAAAGTPATGDGDGDPKQPIP